MPRNNNYETEEDGIRQTVLNAIPNLFWSVLCIAPVYLFCIRFLPLSLLYSFGGISLIPYLLSASTIDSLRISSSPHIYRKLGLRFVSRLTQDGFFVRRFAKYPPTHLSVSGDSKSLARFRRRALQRERFHLTGLVFFAFLTARAALLEERGWTIILLASNIIYNAYPILLQQYVKLRIRRISRR